MIGSTVVASGPRRCSTARTAVTMTAGQRSGSRRRHRTSSRRPMVSTDGLTRSNGSVSQAGKNATSPAGRNCSRSSASWPAIVPVGVTTTSGRRLGEVGQRGDRDRAGHLDDGQAGGGVTEGARERRFVAQQWGECSQAHGTVKGTDGTPAADRASRPEHLGADVLKRRPGRARSRIREPPRPE